MVVVTIATIILTSLVIQQSKWNDNLAVNTQSYEMALMIRQAQIYGLGVREYTTGSGDRFNIAYGVYADKSTTNNAKQYIFFADANMNGSYDSGEAIETKIFNRGVTIDRVCGNTSENCSSPNAVSITFYRPDPKANMVFNPPTGFGPPAAIYLKSKNNKQYKISVQANGQVSVNPVP